MFATPDDESQAKAAALQPWVRRVGRLTAVDFAVTLGCASVLLAKGWGSLGGYRSAGTSLSVGVLILAGPALFPLGLVLFALGVSGWRRVGAGHGFGLTLLGGLVLLPLSVLATLLAIALAAAG